MTLRDKLHQAEDFGNRAAQRGAERVRSAVQKVEASLHGPHPSRRRSSPKLPVSVGVDPEQEQEGSTNAQVRTGIVSVNGRDVGEMRCTVGRHSA